MSAQEPPTYDPSGFSNEPYAKKIDKPWGYEIHWAREDAPYMGKIMHINEGGRLSLQIHDQKQESYLVIKGEASLLWENQRGEMVETKLEPGKGYSTKIGQKHRLVGVTDCDIVEVSTPESGTTWRLEDDYARPHETPDQRQLERQ